MHGGGTAAGKHLAQVVDAGLERRRLRQQAGVPRQQPFQVLPSARVGRLQAGGGEQAEGAVEQAALADQGEAEVLVRVVAVLVGIDGGQAVAFGLVVAAQLDQREAEVVVAEVEIVGVVRLFVEAAAVGGDGALPVPFLLAQDAGDEVGAGALVAARRAPSPRPWARPSIRSAPSTIGTIPMR